MKKCTPFAIISASLVELEPWQNQFRSAEMEAVLQLNRLDFKKILLLGVDDEGTNEVVFLIPIDADVSTVLVMLERTCRGFCQPGFIFVGADRVAYCTELQGINGRNEFQIGKWLQCSERKAKAANFGFEEQDVITGGLRHWFIKEAG